MEALLKEVSHSRRVGMNQRDKPEKFWEKVRDLLFCESPRRTDPAPEAGKAAGGIAPRSQEAVIRIGKKAKSPNHHTDDLDKENAFVPRIIWQWIRSAPGGTS